MSDITYIDPGYMRPNKNNKLPRRIGFLLLKDFTLISLSSAVEPLRMANRISAKTIYRWTAVSIDGEPVAASNNTRNTHPASRELFSDHAIFKTA